MNFRNWILISFYSDSYANEFNNLKRSTDLLKIELIADRIDFRGSWQKTVSYKPEMILKYLKCQDKNVVFVDADATIEKDPVLFDSLDCDVAFHRLRWKSRNELLGGTLFFKNCDKSRSLCEKWLYECQDNFQRWDQEKLDIIISKQDDLRILELPTEYCGIFDHPECHGKELVIKHWQASRRLRKD